MRLLTTVLDLLGLAAIVAGVALVYVPAAFIAGGLGVLTVSWRLAIASADVVPAPENGGEVV